MTGNRLHIAVCMEDADSAQRVETLLHVWAEDLCVRIQTRIAADLSDALETGCGMVMTDGCRQTLAGLCKLRERFPSCGFVFLTDNNRFAIDLYQCRPATVLAKPVQYDRLKAAMARCFTYWHHFLCWMNVPQQHRRLTIPQCQLDYVEASGRNVVLYRMGEAMKVNCSLSVLEQQLPHPPFLRVQKSFIVHLGAVSHIEHGKMILKSGQTISITRGLLRQVQAEFASYQRQRGERNETK